MNAQLFQSFRDIRESYWFVPSIMLIGAILLAFVSEWLDSNIDTSFFAKIPWLYQSHPAGARAVLSAIATSMIGVAGVTFSMTIVSVSFAAANFGPRLIGNFMRDTGNQVTLGTFIATFVYCLSILRTITEASGPTDIAYVPHISLLVALVLTLASVAVLIYFIHHIPESINVERITSMLGANLQSEMSTLFPESLGESLSEAKDAGTDIKFDISTAEAITNVSQGYLQSIDEDSLLCLATENDLTLRVGYSPGDFTTQGVSLLHVLPGDGLDDDLRNELLECFAFGARRTPHQNVLFLIDQMVEIQARALSPGVNDPFTAISCMNWYLPALKVLLGAKIPSPYRFDDQGNCRVIIHPVSIVQIADAVFDQSLQYVSADRNASIATMHLLAELASSSQRDEDTSLILDHSLKLRDATAEQLPLLVDREEINTLYSKLVEITNSSSIRQSERDRVGSLLGGNS